MGDRRPGPGRRRRTGEAVPSLEEREGKLGLLVILSLESVERRRWSSRESGVETTATATKLELKQGADWGLEDEEGMWLMLMVDVRGS